MAYSDGYFMDISAVSAKYVNISIRIYFSDIYLFSKSDRSLAMGIENGRVLVVFCIYAGAITPKWHRLSSF